MDMYFVYVFMYLIGKLSGLTKYLATLKPQWEDIYIEYKKERASEVN